MKSVSQFNTEEPVEGLDFGDALANAFRRWGYLQADLDPLGRLTPVEHADIVDAMVGADPAAIERWRATYAGPVAVEFMHIVDRERVAWIARSMEAPSADVPTAAVWRELARAELFERFLHARYVGSKRYSIEGVAGVIPLLEEMLDAFAQRSGRSVLIAMSHRGRLNVLANIVGVAEREIFAGQEDVDPKSVLGSGDVKYHLGATGVRETRSGHRVNVHLASNPSHLEAVDPVATGRVRAKQDRAGDGAMDLILPITLHGDAAFAGQGITAEALNMAKLPGYDVGGTIHVVVNNLIGFTAEPKALHSSRFASDLGRRLDIPIIHVNGENPRALLRAGRLALEYRNTFHEDVIVDLIGYRRYGHSEVEDPSTTQPLLYRRIADRPMLWESFAAEIGRSSEEQDALKAEIWQRLEKEQDLGKGRAQRPSMRTLPAYWDPYHGGPFDPSVHTETAVPGDRLLEVAEALTALPTGFDAHPKIRRGFDQRLEMARGERPVDWGMAEVLAFGTLLWEGTPVRLAGEDSRRGTFNQRQAVVIDVQTAEEYVPLANLRGGQGRFSVVDSPLSEAAALAFEYGYSRDYPEALVCWEAQFGDFVNGAQTIIDQFVAAGEDKWSLLSGLVMLLPHGFEGQGPEHSSARLERFLQLAAEDNMQVWQPVRACQYFHLLRRQVLQRWRKPLIVLTPKGTLRAVAASSPLEALTSNRCFGPVVGEDRVERAERVLICSGKIFHELRRERERRGDQRTAIVAVDQLYPFPHKALEDELARHAGARSFVWVQEEPANMGALSYIRPHLQRLLGDRQVTSVKRSASASPATGSAKAHALEQQALIRLAFA